MFGYLGVSLTRFISILLIKNTFYKKYGRKTVDNFSSKQKTKADKVLQVGKYRKSKLLPRGRNFFIHSWKTDYATLTEQKVKMVTIHLKIFPVSSNLLCILCKTVPIWSSKLCCYLLRRGAINCVCPLRYLRGGKQICLDPNILKYSSLSRFLTTSMLYA